MILTVCLSCRFAIRVMPRISPAGVGSMELSQLVGRDSSFWPDGYRCPHCEKSMQGVLESEADPAAIREFVLQDLTPQEAFRAFNGFGLPSEQKCSLATVSAVLLANPVKRVHGKNVMGAERTIIDYLELADGTQVHFGAGGEGAVVYRISKPFSCVERVLAEENS